MCRTISSCLSGIVLALLISGCSRGGESDSVQVGKPAPEFQLTDLGGSKVSLSQFRGKIVLLDFWATWCQPCRESMPEMENLQKKYSSQLTLLAINVSEAPDEVRSFLQRERIHSRVLLDQDGAVSNAYRIMAIPMQVLIDRDGVIRNVNMGGGFGLGRRLGAQIDKLIS